VTQYARGAAFERRVMVDLEAHGYRVIRSAGSHSPADVVAFGQSGNLLVQAKIDGRCDPVEWNELWDWAMDGGCMPVLASVGPKRGQIVYRRLTGPKVAGGRGVPAEVFEQGGQRERRGQA
jgi:Holliday junction resolvase